MEWISVKDGLPESGFNVLTYNGNYVHEGYFAYNKNKPRRNIFYISGSKIESDDITHWMPLPEPPKDAK